MQKYKLTAKEFLFLCTALGVSNVYGIEDVYHSINEKNIHREIRNVQKSLEEKQYILSDFDGNSSIDEKLLELVKVCAQCCCFISYVKNGKKTNSISRMYYLTAESIVKSEYIFGEYIIEYIDKKTILKEIQDSIDLVVSKCNYDINVNIQQKVLNTVKKYMLENRQDDAMCVLQEYFNNDVASSIALALSEKENFYSLTTAAFKDKNDVVKNLMVINTEIISLQIEPVIIDFVNGINFKSINYLDIPDMIDEALAKVL